MKRLKQDATNPPQDRERFIGRWVARIFRATHWFMADRLRESNVGYGQFPFLVYISTHEGTCQETIAEDLNYDKATVTRSLQKLEKISLIKRKVSSNDRRKNLLFLTTSGWKVVSQIEILLEEWQGVLSLGFTPNEVEALRGNLVKCSMNAKSFLKDDRKLWCGPKERNNVSSQKVGGNVEGAKRPTAGVEACEFTSHAEAYDGLKVKYRNNEDLRLAINRIFIKYKVWGKWKVQKKSR